MWIYCEIKIQMIKRICKRTVGNMANALAKLREHYGSWPSDSVESAGDRLTIESAWTKPNPNCFIRNERLLPVHPEQSYDLSIIVPLYNSASLIDSLLLGLINQYTEYRYEIILIDDGSSDESFPVAKSWEGRYPGKIKVFHQSNSGIAAARNKGIKESHGKYIGFVDHDDSIATNLVETLLSAAIRYNADCSVCGYDIIKSNVQVSSYTPSKGVYLTSEIRNLYDLGGFVWGGIYRRSLFDRVQFPEGCWYEDILTVPLLYRQCRTVVITDEVLYHKKEHEHNAAKMLWKSENPKCIEQLYLTEDLVEANDSLDLPRDEALLMSIANELSAILWLRTRGLAFGLQKRIFLRAADLLQELTQGEGLALTEDVFIGLGLSGAYVQAFANRDYILWCLLSLAQVTCEL